MSILRMSQADDPQANYWARDEGRAAGAGLRSAAAGGCRVGSGIFIRTSIWAGSREAALGAFDATVCGAVGSGPAGVVQPTCWIALAIICFVCGDQPSSGAFIAIICFAASP